MDRASREFGLWVGFTPTQVVVDVFGELDVLTATDLGVVLDAVVDRGPASVVLDLGEVAFLDNSGLRAIAAASRRLRPVGGVLILRSTPPDARRLLDSSGVSDLVRYERSQAMSGPLLRSVSETLGPEQCSDDSSRATGRPSDGSAVPTCTSVVRANDHVIHAALRLVVTLAKATVGGADGVSVTLSRHGLVETVASTDETIAQMDRDQYATGQGPCLAAAAEGRWFHVESLSEEDRWPAFVPRAIAGGIASILSTPLLVAARPFGALNMYSNAERAFGPAEQELAALFAAQAAGILADAAVDVGADPASERMQDALSSREVIAQAQGVIMERGGVSASAAYGMLRRCARRSVKPVRDTAVDFVASSLRVGRPEIVRTLHD
jgi:anti-anti-sigma factor